MFPFPYSLEVHWSQTGPMFFYTGNEGPIEEFYSNTGFLFTLAQEFNALIVFAEHVRLTIELTNQRTDSIPPSL